jgi:hypothetical protein
MITDSINQARGMGASSDDILNEVYKQNPNLQHSIDSARGLNADSDTILNEITKQNTAPAKKTSFFGDLFNTAKQDYSNITATKNAGMAAAGTSIPKQLLAAGTGVLAAGAEPIKLGWDAIGKAIAPIVTPIAEKSAKEVAQNKIDHPELYGGTSNIAKDDAQVAKLKQGVSDWATEHPQASEALGAALNYASVLPIGKAVDLGTDALKTGSTAAKDLAKSLLPDAEKQATKALSLNPSELKEVNTKRLNWLSEDSLSSGETKQGLFTPKTYTMPNQVKQLATEFKDVLVGTPEKVIQNATELGKGFRQKVLSLFTGSEKAINRDTFLNKVKSAIANDSETIYSTDKEQQQVASKAVANLSKHITTGTNKGIEEGLAKWYSESKNDSGLLSNANQVIQKVVKDTVKSTLPAEKAALYDTYKTKMAKLYDVQEIMKAKVKASIGKSTVQNIANKLKVPAGVIGAWEGGKRLLTGQW